MNLINIRRAADEELDKLDAIRRERDDDRDDQFEIANEREQEDLDEESEDEQDLPPVAERPINLGVCFFFLPFCDIIFI